MTRGRVKFRRAAFTIIELLVTLTIIVMMAGVLLPAIAESREAARRSGCINNLRQVALALQNYETSSRVLPPGVVNSKGPIENDFEGLHIGWITQLLPFMEQVRVYQAIDFDVSVYDPVNRTAATVQLSSLKCPSDRSSGLIKGLGASSYAACHHDVEAPIDVDNHGVFFLNSHVSYNDIPDGASTTIFVGEKRITDVDLGWMSGTRATLRNTGTPINATGSEMTRLQVGGFGSAHPNGANFTFGDGSVRYIHSTIPPDLFRRLGHRDDGELVEEGPY